MGRGGGIWREKAHVGVSSLYRKLLLHKFGHSDFLSLSFSMDLL
jgi:hypothetical protein